MEGVESKLFAGLLYIREVRSEVDQPIAFSKQDGIAIFRDLVGADKDDLGRLVA